MNPKLSLHALAAAACALPLAATAQTSQTAQAPAAVSQLQNIVVTPARIEQPEQSALGDVTVIDSQELQQAGQSSLAEVLARHHSIETYNSGGPQTITGVFLRGANPNQTLVLVDGLRINQAASGGVNWNAIDPSTIERIEIVRGAASSLYGSDAIGGVINIITKKSGEDRPLSAFGNIGLGSYNTFKSSVGLSGASDGWDYGISASLADSGGFNSISSPDTSKDKDGYTQRTLSASLGYRWRPGHHIGLTTYDGYTHADTDAYLASLDPAYAVTRQQIHAITSTDDITDYWQSVLRFGFTKESVDSSDSGSIGSLQRNYSWQNNLKLAPGQNVSVILERREERISGDTAYDSDARNTNSAGLVYRGDFGAHHVQASVRNDNISGYGNETTGGLAYDYDIDNAWRVGVAGNTGFKAPSFNDLYYPALYSPYYNYESNPDLKPEKSRNIEASLRYQTETTKLGLVVYQNKIRDLIDGNACKTYDAFGFCALNSPANVNAATIRGITLTGEQRFGATTVRASADFSNPKDDETGNQLSRRARQVYRLNADHRIAHWILGAEYMFVGRRYDDAANQNSLGGYGLVNLTANYDFTKNVSVQVRWNNVLNKDYTTALYFAPYGYNTPGSNVFVNLAWRM